MMVVVGRLLRSVSRDLLGEWRDSENDESTKRNLFVPQESARAGH